LNLLAHLVNSPFDRIYRCAIVDVVVYSVHGPLLTFFGFGTSVAMIMTISDWKKIEDKCLSYTARNLSSFKVAQSL
jgi:hypothetical protein